MKYKVIENEVEYRQYLEQAENLILLDPDIETEESHKLQLLSLLIETYEKEIFKIEYPDPVEAILFRMEQMGLRQKDLIPVLGHKSKVSEVLSRKRSLSVSMINKLHFKLGIPLESLVGSNKEENKSLKSKDIDVDLFPLKEIVDLGWLKKPIKSVEDALVGFLCPVRENYSEFLCRKSGTLSSEEKEQEYAIQAWVARILEISQKRSKSLSVYRDLSERWMNELVQLSSFDDGPKRALEELEKKGVLCVVEAAPKKSKVDGVSMFLSDGRPVIGLSLRFDRIDNYWYTLMHEIAHVKLHLGAEQSIIIDNIEKIDMSDSIESEADSMAQNVLIPREKWRACMARRTKDKNDVLNFANEIGIHPAIVAGRIRWESGNYSILSEMIGQNGVRSNF